MSLLFVVEAAKIKESLSETSIPCSLHVFRKGVDNAHRGCDIRIEYSSGWKAISLLEWRAA